MLLGQKPASSYPAQPAAAARSSSHVEVDTGCLGTSGFHNCSAIMQLCTWAVAGMACLSPCTVAADCGAMPCCISGIAATQGLGTDGWLS